MSRIIGRGRYVWGTYPVAPGGAAVAALRNRNVAAVPQTLSAPFSPGTGTGTNIAAILFTPKVSGVIQVTALVSVLNGATPDTYAMAAEVDIGTGLSVTGGSGSIISNGWIMGDTAPTAPPVIGGSVSSTQILAACGSTLVGAETATLPIAFAVSQPLAIGVPVIVRIVLDSFGGQALDTIGIASLSVLELP